jgi:hypothetical protein
MRIKRLGEQLALVAQNPTELQYLNRLIQDGKAEASGDSYEVMMTLKEGKSVEDFKVFLSTELHFQVEQEV